MLCGAGVVSLKFGLESEKSSYVSGCGVSLRESMSALLLWSSCRIGTARRELDFEACSYLGFFLETNTFVRYPFAVPLSLLVIFILSLCSPLPGDRSGSEESTSFRGGVALDFMSLSLVPTLPPFTSSYSWCSKVVSSLIALSSLTSG